MGFSGGETDLVALLPLLLLQLFWGGRGRVVLWVGGVAGLMCQRNGLTS
ncbi:hypothetical protein LINGRAHAP2_LOCUS15184 [Linum grandiflorum]